MEDLIHLILSRLRAPLIVLLGAYTISVGILAVAPGTDPAGNPWQLGYFHAFYVMSYTATTIGFGELPYPFSDAQRACLIVGIYLSVVGWTYAIGSIFSLTTDAHFRRTLNRVRFRSRTHDLGEPFYVICGAGQSGTHLARALDRMHFRVVLIDPDEERLGRLLLGDFRAPPLMLQADARLPDVLRDAGVQRPECQGVAALTTLDQANQAIAISTRVLRDDLLVIARVTEQTAQDNLAAFGGVTVINPFQGFATNLALNLRAPAVLQLEDWLTDAPGAPLPHRLNLPGGRWTLVGFGHFGQALANMLDDAGVEWRALDPNPALLREARVIQGDNTESALRAAGVAEASVLVAGSNDDTVNLAVTTLARRINPKILVIVRQNKATDRILIDTARPDLRFVLSELIVRESLQVLKAPLLNTFLQRLRNEPVTTAEKVINRIRIDLGNEAPRTWELLCDVLQPGIFHALLQAPEPPLTLRHLVTDPEWPDRTLPAVPLMLVRRHEQILLPEPDTIVRSGDHILFAGREEARPLHQAMLTDPGTIDQIRTGQAPPDGWLFRRIDPWLRRRLGPQPGRSPDRIGD